jgi:cobalt-zinc-cadmium efflux system outer membrane protein
MYNINNKWSRSFAGLVLAVMLFTQSANAQQTLSLDSILHRIANNNLQLKAYDVKSKSYQYLAEASKGWMAPMVGLGTFMTPYPGQMVMDDKDKGALMFQVEQDIPNPLKQNAQRKAIASKANGVLASKTVKLNDLKYNARQLYYTWLVAEQKLGVLQESAKVMQTMKKVEEIRYPYNQSKLGAVFQTTAKLEELENMKRMQSSEIAKAKAWLNALMNQHGEVDFKIDTALVPQIPLAAAIDTARLATMRGDIQQMDFEIQSMNLNIASMKTQAKPDFKLRFDHMSPLGSGMPKAYSIMGMVSIPIAPWSSKMYKNEVKGMQYEVEAMSLEKSAMLQETQGMLFGMQQQIKLMQAQVKGIEQKVLPTLQKVLDVSVLSYRENKSALPEVIAAWEAVLMMREKVLDEKLKLYLMIADYEKEIYR